MFASDTARIATRLRRLCRFRVGPVHFDRGDSKQPAFPRPLRARRVHPVASNVQVVSDRREAQRATTASLVISSSQQNVTRIMAR